MVSQKTIGFGSMVNSGEIDNQDEANENSQPDDKDKSHITETNITDHSKRKGTGGNTNLLKEDYTAKVVYPKNYFLSEDNYDKWKNSMSEDQNCKYGESFILKGLRRKEKVKKPLIKEEPDDEQITYTQEDYFSNVIKNLKKKDPLEMESYFGKIINDHINSDTVTHKLVTGKLKPEPISTMDDMKKVFMFNNKINEADEVEFKSCKSYLEWKNRNGFQGGWKNVGTALKKDNGKLFRTGIFDKGQHFSQFHNIMCQDKQNYKDNCIKNELMEKLDACKQRKLQSAPVSPRKNDNYSSCLKNRRRQAVNYGNRSTSTIADARESHEGVTADDGSTIKKKLYKNVLTLTHKKSNLPDSSVFDNGPTNAEKSDSIAVNSPMTKIVNKKLAFNSSMINLSSGYNTSTTMPKQIHSPTRVKFLDDTRYLENKSSQDISRTVNQLETFISPKNKVKNHKKKTIAYYIEKHKKVFDQTNFLVMKRRVLKQKVNMRELNRRKSVHCRFVVTSESSEDDRTKRLREKSRKEKPDLKLNKVKDIIMYNMDKLEMTFKVIDKDEQKKIKDAEEDKENSIKWIFDKES